VDKKEGFLVEALLEGEQVELSSQKWLRADEAYPELVALARAKTGEFVGRLILNRNVKVEQLPENVDPTTLLAAVQNAALGDEQSRRLVEVSVSTDLSERMFKSQNETVVEFDVVDGHLMQNGRRNTDVLGNTFRYSTLNGVMFGINKSEQTNAHTFDLLLQNGVLDTHDALVASATTTDTETRKRYNLFTETDTMSLQLLRKEGNKAVLETAFVAGKTTVDGPRHDTLAIRAVAVRNGIDFHEMPEEHLVQFVMLIPKGTLPNGVTSIIEQYDDAVGGTFYGEAVPRQNYAEFSKMCRNRDFGKMTADITDKIIADAHIFKNPMDPLRELDKLSGAAAVTYAVKNSNIDERIFGSEAARIIREARTALGNGDAEFAIELTKNAIAIETSISCPLLDGELASRYGTDEYGSLAFECPDGHVNVRNPGELKETCDFCKISVRC